MKLMLTLLCAAVLPLQAQTLWRCGPDGRHFTDRPCADGSPLSAAPTPSADATAEAHAVVARERLALDRLADERRARLAEAAQRGFGPAAIKPVALPAKDPVVRKKRRSRRSPRAE